MGFVIMSGVGSKVTVPIAGTPLSTFAEGSLIKINESGSPVEFYVAKHNYEQELNSARRTLVVRKDCYDKRAWNSSGINTYESSTVDSWLNGDYKHLLDPAVQTLMGTTKFKYTPGNGNNNVGMLERAIFLLSVTELGGEDQYANTEGTALDIASALMIAYMSGSACTQWLRTPYADTGNNGSFCVYSNGVITHFFCTDSEGIRPAFTLPANTKIDDNGLVVA